VRVVSLNVNGLRAAERKGARALLAELDADDEGRDALVVGDLNIAHAEIDLRNWRANRRTSGFLPEERAWLSEALALGYVDVVRELAGLETAAYSWWSWTTAMEASSALPWMGPAGLREPCHNPVTGGC
jgi:exonuclease III